jgi:hypothetical protein
MVSSKLGGGEVKVASRKQNGVMCRIDKQNHVLRATVIPGVQYASQIKFIYKSNHKGS